MEEKVCERCGAAPRGWHLLDYCAVCSQNLCDHCMAEGCCGNVPAESGMEADYPDEVEAVEHSVQSDLGGTSAQEVSPNEKDTGEGWGPQGNRPSR